MRTPRQLLVAISFVVLVLPVQGAGLHRPDQKPVKRTVAFDHPADASEVADVPRLFAASDLVVVGRVVAERPADFVVDPKEPGLISIQTAYSVSVTEVFRQVPRAGTRDRDLEPLKAIEVIISHVGDRDRGEYIERYVSAKVNAPQADSTCLLFLRRRVGDDAWMLTTNSGRSIVEIRGSVVAPQDSSPEALEIAKKSWPELRRDLLQLAGGSK